MQFSAFSATVLACPQHLAANLVPSVTCGQPNTSKVPAAQNARPGLHPFGFRILLASSPSAAAHDRVAHATETIISDGARDQSIRACLRQRAEPIMQARVGRANGTGGGHRVLRNEPHAPCSKVSNPKVPNPAPRYHRVRLGTVARRPLGATRLALRCRHLCRDLTPDAARSRCDQRTTDQSRFIRLSTSRPSRP
jgi:hypothetical protein